LSLADGDIGYYNEENCSGGGELTKWREGFTSKRRRPPGRTAYKFEARIDSRKQNPGLS